MFGIPSNRAWRVLICAMVLGSANATPLCRGAVVVDHQPHNFGGPASDMLLIHPMTGQTTWQLAADSFILPAATQIKTIRWWGFYDADNPPTTEIMRIRLHDSRTDGLPGSVLFDYEVTNPIRIDTGRRILTGILPHEYRYRVDLTLPVSLQANTRYWLQVAAIGDINSHFRWVVSTNTASRFAFQNSGVPDWQLTTQNAGTAFQLVAIPEPSAAISLMMWLLLRLQPGRVGTR